MKVKSAKQCRERWVHHLDPNIKKIVWTQDSNQKLFSLHKKIGNHWKDISEFFEGRTDKAIKN